MIISGKAITNKNKDIIRLYFSKEQYDDDYGVYYINLPYDFNLFSNIILTQKKQEDEKSYKINFYFDTENKTCKAITSDGEEKEGLYGYDEQKDIDYYDFHTIFDNNWYSLEIYYTTKEARFFIEFLEEENIEWARIDLIKGGK